MKDLKSIKVGKLLNKTMIIRNFLFLLMVNACLNVGSTGYYVDKKFDDFKVRFLDPYLKQYPFIAISVGYKKYFENLPLSIK
ncbi:MAG: hypothetical protein NVSMB67_30030 [Flavisolibacter sp.]